MSNTETDTPTETPRDTSAPSEPAPTYHAVDPFADDIWELIAAAERKGYPHEVKKNGRRVL